MEIKVPNFVPNCAKNFGTITIKQKRVLNILLQRKEGLRIEELVSLTNIPRRSLYRFLADLKDKKLVENIFPVWKILPSFPMQCQNQSGVSEMAQTLQLHNISFILKLINKPVWWESRENQLTSLKEFQFRKEVKWGNVTYKMFEHDSFLIQTFANSIIYINKKHYLGSDAYDCFLQALNDVLELHSYIEKKLNFKFVIDEAPQFTIRSQHYVKLKDAIAERCLRQGNLLKVIINGKLRAWVDASEPLGMELGHRNYAPEDASRYSKFVQDIINNNPPTNSQLATHILQVSNNQEAFAQNLVSHIEAIRNLSSGVNNLVMAVKKLEEKVEKI